MLDKEHMDLKWAKGPSIPGKREIWILRDVEFLAELIQEGPVNWKVNCPVLEIEEWLPAGLPLRVAKYNAYMDIRSKVAHHLMELDSLGGRDRGFHDISEEPEPEPEPKGKNTKGKGTEEKGTKRTRWSKLVKRSDNEEIHFEL